MPYERKARGVQGSLPHLRPNGFAKPFYIVDLWCLVVSLLPAIEMWTTSSAKIVVPASCSLQTLQYVEDVNLIAFEAGKSLEWTGCAPRKASQVTQTSKARAGPGGQWERSHRQMHGLGGYGGVEGFGFRGVKGVGRLSGVQWFRDSWGFGFRRFRVCFFWGLVSCGVWICRVCGL